MRTWAAVLVRAAGVGLNQSDLPLPFTCVLDLLFPYRNCDFAAQSGGPWG